MLVLQVHGHTIGISHFTIIHLTISNVRDIFFYNLIGLAQKNRGAHTIVEREREREREERERERELLVLGPTWVEFFTNISLELIFAKSNTKTCFHFLFSNPHACSEKEYDFLNDSWLCTLKRNLLSICAYSMIIWGFIKHRIPFFYKQLI